MTLRLYQDGTKKLHAWAEEVDNNPIQSRGLTTISGPDSLLNHKKFLDEMKDDLAASGTSSGCCSGLEQFTQETSFTGFKYIGGTNSGVFRRMFWLVIVIGALTGLTVQIYLSTYKYVSHETNTKLSYDVRDELLFPEVTFCNTNMFRLSELSKFYGGYIGTYYNGIEEVRQLFMEDGLISSPTTQDGEYNIPPTYPGRLNLHDFIMQSAHLTENMIEMCKFNGQICGPENFTIISTSYGVCFKFNSTSIVNTPGQSQGLSLILNCEESEVVAAPRENIGFKMLVHPRDEYPNLKDYGIELQPGTHTPVRIDITEMSSLPDPYGTCGTKTLRYLNGGYTESKCFLECETDYVVRQCGCRHFYMPGNATFCSPVKLTTCFYKAIETFGMIRNRLCSCPDACQETSYKPTISLTSFPSNGVATTLATKNDNDTRLAEAFGEYVKERLSTVAMSSYTEMHMDILWATSIMSDENGTRLIDTYPNLSDTLIDLLMENIFGNMQYEILNSLTSEVWYEILGEISMEVGSSVFNETTANQFWRYLFSGDYRETIAEAFLVSGSYSGLNDSQEFEDFIDSVFERFYLDWGFHYAYYTIYSCVYRLVIEYSTEISEMTDITDIATNYMRKNLLEVHIFYGDLKVEQIVEQPSYEVFQFVCDLGGELGLFFGASLLSFIETVDFWCTRKDGCCGSSVSSKEKKQQDTQIIFVKQANVSET